MRVVAINIITSKYYFLLVCYSTIARFVEHGADWLRGIDDIASQQTA